MRPAALFSAIAALTAACSGETGDTAAQSAMNHACAGDGVVVSDAWMRPARTGQPTGAAYLMLCNGAETDDALLGASFEGADAAELHMTNMSADGMTSMKHSTEIAIPAGETAMLEPEGAHIMLIGMNEALEPGDEALITLTFRNAPSVSILFDVREDTAGEHARH